MKKRLLATMLCAMLSSNSIFCGCEIHGCVDAKKVEEYKKDALKEFFCHNLLAATAGAVIAVFKVTYSKTSHCPCLFDSNVTWEKCGKIALIGGGIGAGLYTTLKIFGMSDASISCFFKSLLFDRHHCCHCYHCDCNWYIPLDTK